MITYAGNCDQYFALQLPLPMTVKRGWSGFIPVRCVI